MKNLAFILYDSRSGSTLLSSLLNRYKGISVSLESAFASRVIEYSDDLNKVHPNKIIDYLFRETQFRELELNSNLLKKRICLQTAPLTKKNLITVIIDQYFSDRDSEALWWIVKHPPYPYMSTIVNYFPNAKFVQIVRDGRGVYSSKKNTTSLSGNKMETNPVKAAWDWKLKLKRADVYSDCLITIKYENLIKDEESELEKILNFLQIPKNLQIKTKERTDYSLNIGEKQKELHKNVNDPLKQNNINKWKNNLKFSELNVYEFINKDYLKKNDYTIVTNFNLLTRVFFIKYFLLYVKDRIINFLATATDIEKLKNKLHRNYLMISQKKN